MLFLFDLKRGSHLYLAEIQGLRVVAAFLVAVYHIWFHQVSGGVDAFFVIAGFFILRTLFKSDVPGRMEVLTYYRRTLARVLPSAAVIILATCAMFYILQHDSLWPTQIRSALAALLFIENWHLAAQGVDYLAQGELPSPFQQMWALSVQMQIYLALPPLLLLLSRIAGQEHIRISFPGLVLLTALIAFGFALWATWHDQPKAYFNSIARLWEFLAGVLLALSLPRLRLPQRSAKLLGYLCLLVLVGFAALVPVAESFPGLPALIPVLATSGIIVAASNGAGLGFLNNAPMQWLGNLSFTFYLCHWPLLVAWRLSSGSDRIGLLPGLGILLLAGLLAYATYVLIERPYRNSPIALSSPARSISASLALLVPAGMACGLWAFAYVENRNIAQGERQAFLRGETVGTLVPATIIAKGDVPASYRRNCNQRYGQSRLLECDYGSADAPVTLALVGGSHSLHWLPALQAIARRNPSLRIISMTKGNCPVTLSSQDLQLTDEARCLEWGRRVIDRLKEIQPDAIVTLLTSTRAGAESGTETVPAGFRQFWQEIAEFSVLAIRDTPRGEHDMLACVDRLGSASDDCRIPRARDDALSRSGNLPRNLVPVDLTEFICEPDFCPAVRDGVLVFRDASHLTATYAELLAPHLDHVLAEMGLLEARMSTAQ